MKGGFSVLSRGLDGGPPQEKGQPLKLVLVLEDISGPRAGMPQGRGGGPLQGSSLAGHPLRERGGQQPENLNPGLHPSAGLWPETGCWEPRARSYHR